jgi:hypothetical protein
VNGRDAAAAFGKVSTVDGNEEGQGHTAYWIRDVSLESPGTYEVTASAEWMTRNSATRSVVTGRP